MTGPAKGCPEPSAAGYKSRGVEGGRSSLEAQAASEWTGIRSLIESRPEGTSTVHSLV